MLEKLPEAIGHLLVEQRAGMEKIVSNNALPDRDIARIEVASPAFANRSPIPRRFTADGEGISPSIHWSGIPSGTAALVLIVEDADSPTPEPLVHAIIVDVAPDETGFVEGALHSPAKPGAPHCGLNSYLMHGWLPPDPPPGHGVHRYVFQLFALGTGDSLSKSPGRHELAVAIRERAIGKGWFIGTYERAIRQKVEEPEASDGAIESSPATAALA
jgi:Raf kinase inhibitor-like YbhB/YbcL family protein